MKTLRRIASSTKDKTEDGFLKSVQKGDVRAVESELSRSSSSITLRNTNDQRCALHVAAKMGYKDVCSLLLQKGADVHAVDKEGMTALHLAVLEKLNEICVLLLDSGANVDARDKSGRTPLHWGASANAANVCRLLLDRGADVNAVNKRLSSALHISARKLDWATCGLLMARGIDLGLKDKHGKGALDMLSPVIRQSLMQQMDILRRTQGSQPATPTAAATNGSRTPEVVRLQSTPVMRTQTESPDVPHRQVSAPNLSTAQHTPAEPSSPLITRQASGLSEVSTVSGRAAEAVISESTSVTMPGALPAAVSLHAAEMVDNSPTAPVAGADILETYLASYTTATAHATGHAVTMPVSYMVPAATQPASSGMPLGPPTEPPSASPSVTSTMSESLSRSYTVSSDGTVSPSLPSETAPVPLVSLILATPPEQYSSTAQYSSTTGPTLIHDAADGTASRQAVGEVPRENQQEAVREAQLPVSAAPPAPVHPTAQVVLVETPTPAHVPAPRPTPPPPAPSTPPAPTHTSITRPPEFTTSVPPPQPQQQQPSAPEPRRLTRMASSETTSRAVVATPPAPSPVSVPPAQAVVESSTPAPPHPATCAAPPIAASRQHVDLTPTMGVPQTAVPVPAVPSPTRPPLDRPPAPYSSHPSPVPPGTQHTDQHTLDQHTYDGLVAMFVEMGFAEGDVHRALGDCEYDADLAIELLTASATGVSVNTSHTVSTPPTTITPVTSTRHTPSAQATSGGNGTSMAGATRQSAAPARPMAHVEQTRRSPVVSHVPGNTAPRAELERPPTPPVAKGPECPICLDAIKQLSSTPCGHVFCRDCIRMAIRTTGACPVCRKGVQPNQVIRVYFG